jgi:long-chain acyl-CoA synthetase
MSRQATGKRRAAKTQEQNEGWLRTGDLSELDAEGNLRFRGRKKNVIVTPAGLNVYPEDLETAVKNHPVIRDCVVIPLDHGGNAEPCAVLLLNGSLWVPTQKRKPLSNPRTLPSLNTSACTL